jgi:hypothetical protein
MKRATTIRLLPRSCSWSRAQSSRLRLFSPRNSRRAAGSPIQAPMP